MGKIVRVVVCGSKGVGKTALLQQLAFGIDITDENYIPTIEDTYTVQVDGEKCTKDTKDTIIFYDTAGFDARSVELKKCYIQAADAYIIVYSVDSVDAFNRMDLTKSFLEKAMKERKEPSVPLIVLANKTDLTNRSVEKDFAASWAQNEKAKLYEVTAKNRKSLMEPMDYLCKKVFTAPKETKFTLTKRIKEKQPGTAIVMDI